MTVNWRMGTLKTNVSQSYIQAVRFVIRGFDYSSLVNYYAQNLLSAYFSLAYMRILHFLMAIMNNKIPKQKHLFIPVFDIHGISDNITPANI
jgi:hypothetical protein